jgi:hypothetical protein
MANRGPLAAVVIVDPIFAGRGENANGGGSVAFPPFTVGNGAGTDGGALAGNVVLTVDELLTGFYTADAGGSNRTLTLPSFANITNATSGLLKGIGDRFSFSAYNAGASNNLVITGTTNVTVLVQDTGDATIAPAHCGVITLLRVSATDVVALCTLFQ